MRIGFDIDGVLADFIPAYQDMFIEITGRNTFAAGDRRDPPAWDWPELRGYAKEETSAVWETIKQSETFWLNLAEDRGCSTLSVMLSGLERKHDVYYLTMRVGQRVKRQSEIWLYDHLKYGRAGVWPSVCIAAQRQKGHLVRGLALDAYIDDNLDNVNDIAAEAPMCRTYLLNRAYNRAGEANPAVVRVDTVGELFDAEIKLGNL